MRGRGGFVILLATVGLALPCPGAAAQTIEVGQVLECFEAAPAVVAAGTDPVVELRVHVLLDEGVGLEFGRQVMARVAAAYEPLGVRVAASYTRTVTASDDTSDLIAHSKALFGGERPPWAHVVYLLTPRDIVGSSPAVAGQADCIGGIAFPDAAFAVGEVQDDGHALGPLTLGAEQSAKIAAHEIGHLLGAHHHYANCVEGTAHDPATDVSPCTLMFNDISLLGLGFSSFNGAVVRGHAVTYAPPLSASPPQDGSPTSPPELRSCELLSHRDRAGDATTAVPANNPDDIDLLEGWFLTDPRDVRFLWVLASADGEFTPGVSFVRYRLQIDAPRALLLEAIWDGSSPPAARVYEGGTLLAETSARVVTGRPGHLEAVLPLADLGLAGSELVPGWISALTDLDDQIDYDTAAPALPKVRPAACAEPVPAGNPPARQAPPAPASRRGALAFRIDERSARRIRRDRRVRVHVSGSFDRLRLRLVDARRRVVAEGSARRQGTVRLRLRRRPAAGRHQLVVTGRGVRQRIPLRLRR